MRTFLILLAFAVLLVNDVQGAENCTVCLYYEEQHIEYKADSPERLCLDDPTKSSLVVPCGDSGPYQCVKKSGKVTITIDEKDEDFKFVHRYCQPTSPLNENTCLESDALDTPYGPTAKKGHKCYCNEDGCNSATSMGTGILSILAVFATVVFYRMH